MFTLASFALASDAAFSSANRLFWCVSACSVFSAASRASPSGLGGGEMDAWRHRAPECLLICSPIRLPSRGSGADAIYCSARS